MPTGIDEDGSEERLERVGKDRFLVASARLILPSPEKELWADADSASHLGESRCVHHRCPQLGQLAFCEVAVDAEDVLGDCQAENGVTKELEPFVRLGCVRLGTVTAMRERQLEQRMIGELVPQVSGQIVGVGRLFQESAPTWL